MNFHGNGFPLLGHVQGQPDCLYLRTNGLHSILPHELPLLSMFDISYSGTFLIRAGPLRDHERHEFPWEWLPSLGACPKATWMTSICEPTVYGGRHCENPSATGISGFDRTDFTI